MLAGFIESLIWLISLLYQAGFYHIILLCSTLERVKTKKQYKNCTIKTLISPSCFTPSSFSAKLISLTSAINSDVCVTLVCLCGDYRPRRSTSHLVTSPENTHFDNHWVKIDYHWKWKTSSHTFTAALHWGFSWVEAFPLNVFFHFELLSSQSSLLAARSSTAIFSPDEGCCNVTSSTLCSRLSSAASDRNRA